jgi:hypothetical protein
LQKIASELSEKRPPFSIFGHKICQFVKDFTGLSLSTETFEEVISDNASITSRTATLIVTIKIANEDGQQQAR